MKISGTPKRRPRILVVEDEPDIQMFLSAVLTRGGFEVYRADSGLAALATFATILPDLILLDLSMPDMDGMTFLKRRATIDKVSSIPVIVLSARDRSTDVMAAMENGAANYITKPFDNVRLLGSINKLLEGRPGLNAQCTQVSW